jgi:Bifunctional DNA primase/polymerase, N-terminal
MEHPVSDTYAPGVPIRRPHPAQQVAAEALGDDVHAGRPQLGSALSLAIRGWHVFPCVPGGKRPALRGNWQDLASADPDRVRDWWARGPYNIGVACGPSGLVVIDLDVPRAHHADDQDEGLAAAPGASMLTALCEEHGQAYPLPTYAVSTPSGGCHLYYAAPDEPVRNSAGRLGGFIDVRGDGGYVIGAGSRAGARAYTARDRRPPAPLPAWIAALLNDDPPGLGPHGPALVPGGARGAAYAMAALREETRRVATARKGTRNDTLNRAAFSLGQLTAAWLLPPAPVITALEDAARRAGLPAGEARRTIASGMAAGARNPRR